MKTGIFPEYLGNIDAEALLQNVKNENRAVSSLANLRKTFPKGFALTAEFECRIFESEQELETLSREMQARLESFRKSHDLEDLQDKEKKLVRIVLEPF